MGGICLVQNQNSNEISEQSKTMYTNYTLSLALHIQQKTYSTMLPLIS